MDSTFLLHQTSHFPFGGLKLQQSVEGDVECFEDRENEDYKQKDRSRVDHSLKKLGKLEFSGYHTSSMTVFGFMI